MTATREELEAYTTQMFAAAGAAIASTLFAAEITWPADTPDRCFEQAWDTAITNLREGVAEILAARGITDTRSVAILQDIAVDGFTNHFTKLNDGWMSQGGTA
ncbi:hypothetical protein EJV44_11315 [Ancylobacter aquaticus]|nr:hypothetical protein EJV44_11315 [Ancylobacter aquaticus]